MALVNCKECGEQVSTKAATCPKCGAKVPKKTSIGTWLVIVFVLVVVYAANQSPSDKSPSATSSTTVVSTSSTEKATPMWDSSTSVDEMTGKTSSYATSPIVPSKRKMDFPYGDVKAWLGVGCDGTNEWAYLGFNSAPNLADTETESGYSRISTRIKWDDKVENITLTQDWGASFIHFTDDKSAIKKISTSHTALLELKWYGEQPTYFEFPLDGASTALENMRRTCASKGKK